MREFKEYSDDEVYSGMIYYREKDSGLKANGREYVGFDANYGYEYFYYLDGKTVTKEEYEEALTRYNFYNTIKKIR